MNSDHKVTLAICSLTALLIGWVGHATLQAEQVPTGSNIMVTESSIEQYFLENMIPHHQGAIDMATIAMQKSETDEVRQLSEAILATQQAEIDQMTAWLKDWYGVDYANSHAAMGHGMHSMMGDLTALNRARNFDTEFVRQMIPHHESAVIMADMLLAANPRPELKTLAENIITAQQAEISSMKTWLARWTQ
jgi:uncharacterized protein (DUF305 family)